MVADFESMHGRAAWYTVESEHDIAPDALHVLACGEEGGGTEALIPVLSELQRRGIGATALVGGIGLARFGTVGVRHGLRLSPHDGEPGMDVANGLLLSPSYDGGMEEYLMSRYAGAPAVLTEDYYESSRYVIARALANGLDVPLICTVDNEAVRLISRRFSDVTAETRVTGSPAFDVLADEDTAVAARHVKAGLGLVDGQKLAVFLMPNLHHTQLAAEVAASCHGLIGDDVVLTARAHPADSLSSEDFTWIFSGVPYVESTDYTPDEVAAAADLVIVQRSTHGLRAALRQKPSISLREYVPDEFTLPLVDAGASVEVPSTAVGPMILELLQGTSQRCINLRAAMQPYEIDGKAAARVADIVCELMGNEKVT